MNHKPLLILFFLFFFLVALLYFTYKNRDIYIVCKCYSSYLLEICKFLPVGNSLIFGTIHLSIGSFIVEIKS